MKLRHFDYDGRARFITICTHRRIPILIDDVIAKILIDGLKEIRNRFNLKIVAYVIMPEHLHLIVIPQEKDRIGFIIGEFKRITSKKIHEYLKIRNERLLTHFIVTRNRIERFAFWMRRCYDHNIRSEESFWQKVAYCHNNPVKRDLAKIPQEYIWSSCRFYCGYRNALLEIDEIA